MHATRKEILFHYSRSLLSLSLPLGAAIALNKLLIP